MDISECGPYGPLYLSGGDWHSSSQTLKQNIEIVNEVLEHSDGEHVIASEWHGYKRLVQKPSLNHPQWLHTRELLRPKRMSTAAFTRLVCRTHEHSLVEWQAIFPLCPTMSRKDQYTWEPSPH